MNSNRKKIFSEMVELGDDLANVKPFGSSKGAEGETIFLNTYSTYLSAKSHEELLKSAKNYNRFMIGFGILNLVFAFINLYLFFSNK